MKKIEGFHEVLEHLRHQEVLVDTLNSFFVLKKDKIYHYHNGSRIILSFEDFIELYAHTSFYLYEEEEGIDPLKDAEYYAFRHK